jgi:hypothetical protein
MSNPVSRRMTPLSTLMRLSSKPDRESLLHDSLLTSLGEPTLENPDFALPRFDWIVKEI